MSSMGVAAGFCVLAAVLVLPASRSERAVLAHLRRSGRDDVRPLGRLRAVVDTVVRRAGGSIRRTGEDATRWLPLLDQLSAALRVGLPPAETLALTLRAGPSATREHLALVLEAAREGRSCGPAWLRAARATSSVELELLARAWGISERLGAPLADAVDSAAHAMRAHRDLASRLETATAGARTTATILTLLPVAGIGMALMMGVGPTTLYGSPVALLSLGLGVVLIALGRVVVARMIARAVRTA
ncbi:type II secretion system F family protein [Ornithinimicrobium cavernae]|uniref:type II secretion system F family protein n=1 Tax=Ornithinimicrobium cavernae TaxID=2666047 RepID=UPI000D693413|nr:type II secretion system F family protein [Ornithinimicrobium cavernae]